MCLGLCSTSPAAVEIRKPFDNKTNLALKLRESIKDYVTQHPLVQHPLETPYDLVVDEPHFDDLLDSKYQWQIFRVSKKICCSFWLSF
jgi:hypothetical protein